MKSSDAVILAIMNAFLRNQVSSLFIIITSLLLEFIANLVERITKESLLAANSKS